MQPTHTQQFDIVAVGASAGGVEAISRLLNGLPCGLPATVLVVLHRPPAEVSRLAAILSKGTQLKVSIAIDGEELRYGRCLIGEPERHLTIGPDRRVQLLPDHFYRAHNIDALFSSLAHHAGNRAIGVILSGALKDGALGLKRIKEAGGLALVQSPKEAAHADMPEAAIAFDGPIDLVAPVDDLAHEICRIVGAPSVTADIERASH